MLGNILSQIISAGVTGYAESYNKKTKQLKKKLLKLAVNGGYEPKKENFTVGYSNIDVECYIISIVFAAVSIGFIIPETIMFFIEKQITPKLIVGAAMFVIAVIIYAIGRLSKKFPELKADASGLEYKNNYLPLRDIGELEIKRGKVKITNRYGENFFSCDEDCAGVVDLIAWANKNGVSIIANEYH